MASYCPYLPKHKLGAKQGRRNQSQSVGSSSTIVDDDDGFVEVKGNGGAKRQRTAAAAAADTTLNDISTKFTSLDVEEADSSTKPLPPQPPLHRSPLAAPLCPSAARPPPSFGRQTSCVVSKPAAVSSEKVMTSDDFPSMAPVASSLTMPMVKTPWGAPIANWADEE